MSINDSSIAEDTEMAEEDGEKVVTMMDVLQEQQDFEDDANAVLGASDDKECTYSKGYIKRQAVYACLTCCTEARDDPEKRAGVCLACSLNCHENHDLIELYTKRNFCCDCGNPKFNSNPCQFTSNKANLNSENVYNQNFSGLYCICHRPYPDPDTEFEDEMIQCVVCEDWLHSQHLEAKVPPMENYTEMICKGCMDKNEFLHDYSEFAVNIIENGNTVNGMSDASHLNGTENISVDVTNEITDQSIDVDESIINEPSVAEKCILDQDGITHDCISEVNGDISEKAGDIIHVKTLDDKREGNEAASEANVGSIAKNDDVSHVESIAKNFDEFDERLPEKSEQTSEEKNENPEADSVIGDQHHDKDVVENNTKNENALESQPVHAAITTEENTSNLPEISSTENDVPIPDVPVEPLPSEANLEVPIKEGEVNVEPYNKEYVELAVEGYTKQDDELKVEASSVEDKQFIIEEETAEISTMESDKKPGESSKMEDTTLESNQIESSEERANDLNLENNNETNKNIECTENKEKPQPFATSDTLDSKETNGDASNDIAMAEADTSKAEIAEMSITNETEKDATTTDIPDIPKITNVIDNENKRKLSTEELGEEDSSIKKLKLDSDPNCIKPKNIKKTYKGATFWPSNFRQQLCKCNHCLNMYKDLSVLFLIDVEDTVSFYEALGKEKSNGTPTQYEQGLEALSSLDRIQQINALTEYNIMRDKLLDFLKSFKERKEVVKEEDIKAFFAGMKPKREPDGVYFCR